MVLTGWGWYSETYSVWTNANGSQYQAWTGPAPGIPYSWGPLPDSSLTFQVRGNGFILLQSPVATEYFLLPVSSEPPPPS